jgi:O-antigen/teichoic acid export membrane protein
MAFMIRVASAALAYLSQVVLARFMGTHEFGIFVYVWTWALLIGSLADAGLGSAAQRFIPEYNEHKSFDLLRGFLAGSRLISLAAATLLALIAALATLLAAPLLDSVFVIPLYIACLCLPIYALCNVQDGIARCYNWINVGLVPTFVVRPLLLLALMIATRATGFASDAQTAIICTVISFWLIGGIQTLFLNRRLAVTVENGERAYEAGRWLHVSLPIVMATGFYMLLSYVDILVLQQFRPPEDVAHYHAAIKTLTLVSFVYFSVAAATAHRFSEYGASGDRAKLHAFVANSVRWTFWPSLAITIVILALGKPLLSLFGSDFAAAYPVMFIAAIGLLARASVGPAERMLSMLGEQYHCAGAFAAAFCINLFGCVMLTPNYGIIGAAFATSLALVFEALVLYSMVKSRLGLHAFAFGARGAN